MTDKEIWAVKIDWLRILNLLGLNSIKQIPEDKKEKAIKKLSKVYGKETLLELENEELDLLLVNELKDSMRKELTLHEKNKERIERKMRNSMIPFKDAGVIRFNPQDFKDLDPNADPEDIFKYLYKKFTGKSDIDDEDENDDDKDKYTEDNTGYYI